MTSADEMRVRLRAATSADHAFLRRLNREAYEPLALQLFGLWDEPAQEARIDGKLQRLAFRVVEFEGEPVGAIATETRNDHLFLHEMMLLPAWQGRGLGSIVLRHLIREAEAACLPIRLHTPLRNRAQGLYRRHGFVETGRDAMFLDMERSIR